MSKLKFHIVFSLLFFLKLSYGQDTVIQLISKVDLFDQHQLWDGNTTMLMGYTQTLSESISLPSPTIIVKSGDSVELKLRNMSQPAAHTIHLHGLDVNQENDGVPHLSFIVEHNENKSYYFKAPHPGTYLYHCHVVSSLHVQAGMYGLLIVKPSDNSNTTWDGGYSYSKEYAFLSSELDTHWHSNDYINHPYDSAQVHYLVPDYHPQYFLINGKSEGQLTGPENTIESQVNEEVYLRLANIGNYGNTYHFPSALNARIISSDGRPLPAVENNDTLEIYPGERYGVLINASQEMLDSIQVKYYNLNTLQEENSQKIPVRVIGFLGVKELEKEKILLYPNPVNNRLVIQGSNKKNEKIEVMIKTLEGKTLLQKITKEERVELDLSHLANGPYLIYYICNQELKVQKIIVNHE